MDLALARPKANLPKALQSNNAVLHHSFWTILFPDAYPPPPRAPSLSTPLLRPPHLVTKRRGGGCRKSCSWGFFVHK